MTKANIVVVTLMLTTCAFARPDAAPQSTQSGVAGRWNVSFQTKPKDVCALEVKPDGETLAGTICGQNGPTPIHGEFISGTLTFAPMQQDGSWRSSYTATLKADGTLAGNAYATLIDDTGARVVTKMVEWTAVRATSK